MLAFLCLHKLILSSALTQFEMFSGSLSDVEITTELIKMVREKIGPVASTGLAAVGVPGLPKTRSGKIARKSLSDMASGKPYKISPTIEDPSIYPKIALALKNRGYWIDK